MTNYNLDSLGIPVRWKFSGSVDRWWRVGFWIHFDLRAPTISIRFLWWIVGFGRFTDFSKCWKDGLTNSRDCLPGRRFLDGETLIPLDD
jgi:hypothetical protein